MKKLMAGLGALAIMLAVAGKARAAALELKSLSVSSELTTRGQVNDYQAELGNTTELRLRGRICPILWIKRCVEMICNRDQVFLKEKRTGYQSGPECTSYIWVPPLRYIKLNDNLYNQATHDLVDSSGAKVTGTVDAEFSLQGSEGEVHGTTGGSFSVQ